PVAPLVQDPFEHGRDQRHDGRLAVIDGPVDAPGVEVGVNVDGDPVDHGPEEDGEAAYVKERQACQPAVTRVQSEIECGSDGAVPVVAEGDPGALGAAGRP